MNDHTHAVHSAETEAQKEIRIAAEAAAHKTATINGIRAKFDNKIDVKEVSFHFKTKELEDAEGKKTGDKFKRPTVSLHLPVLSVEGLVHILEKEGNEKELALVMETLNDTIIARARTLVNEKEDITQDTFPLSSITWESIANLPRAERRGGGIDKETWEEFAADYIAVMPALTNKTIEQVTNAANIYLQKFNSCKTNKPVLTKLKEQLTLYITNTPKAEQFTECVDFLTNKADNLLKVDEAALLNNL